MDTRNIQQIRKEYRKGVLDEDSVGPDPFIQFGLWFEDAVKAGIEEPSAMFLATSGADGRPSGRVLLLKGINKKGFVFFTNYGSRKAKEISENPNATIVFHWKEIERQVRIAGRVSRISVKESDDYFDSRPFDSRVSAAISPQSAVIRGRIFLEKERERFISCLGDQKIKRPANWGGFLIKPYLFEFWQGRESRLHDRIQYRLVKMKWTIERLAP
jgi:pyridoxamine 5'-phosphate oxidase